MKEYSKELINFCKEYVKRTATKRYTLSIKCNYKKELTQIKDETKFLNLNNIQQMIYHITNELYEIPKCKMCNGVELNFYNIKNGYTIYCSPKCQNSDPDKIKKYENSMEKKYGKGIKTSFQAAEVKEKSDQTKLERYGDETYTNPKKQKQTMLEKYGVEHNWQIRDENGDRPCELTMLDKYGEKTPFNVEEIKDNIKATMLENFGVEYPFQSKEILNKAKETLFDKYGVENSYLIPHIIQKSQETQSRLINKLINSNRKFNTDYRKLAKENKIFWNLGLNETEILDKVEQDKGITLERQKVVCGYFVDGYDEENNVCYEVDELHHQTEEQIEKDKLREQTIIKELSCEFIRIPDLTH